MSTLDSNLEGKDSSSDAIFSLRQKLTPSFLLWQTHKYNPPVIWIPKYMYMEIPTHISGNDHIAALMSRTM